MSAHFGRAVPVALRRFPALFGQTLTGNKVVVPECFPDKGFHLVSLNFKNKHVWNALTWNGLASSLDLVAQHSNQQSVEMYYVWLFPLIHRLWAPIWRKRCRQWATERAIDHSQVISVYGDRDAICEQIGIHNDGRQYAFLVTQTGKILFGSDGRYQSHKHDFHIHKAIKISPIPTQIGQDETSSEKPKQLYSN